jgi:hypothetical protein
MKNKSSKRILSNKYDYPQQHRRDHSCDIENAHCSTSSIRIESARNRSIDPIESDCVRTKYDSPCLEQHRSSKSQRLLKRDLLRCSESRLSLFDRQSLLFDPIAQCMRSKCSSLADCQTRIQHRSVSVNLDANQTRTNDRFGPWPDVSICQEKHSNSNDSIRRSKNLRHLRASHHSSINDKTTKFKFDCSTELYIDEYRKQKGYMLDVPIMSSPTCLLLQPEQQSDVDDQSAAGLSSVTWTDINSRTSSDIMSLSASDISLVQCNKPMKSIIDGADHSNSAPSIPTITKMLRTPYYFHHLPSIAVRNNHFRPIRARPHHPLTATQPSIVLPSLIGSSIQYLNSLTQSDRSHSTSQTKSLSQTPSKLVFIQAQPKKR